MWGRKSKGTPQESHIEIYGTTWCGMTQMVRRYLDRNSVSYKFVDLDNDPAAVNQLRWITGGYASHPTVVIDGHALVEPSLDELERALLKNGYL